MSGIRSANRDWGGKEEHKKDKMVTEERKHQENAGKVEKKKGTRKGRRGKMLREEKRVEIRKEREKKKKKKKKGKKREERGEKASKDWN